ncbi:MAG: hypothetical protein ACQEP1_04180 [Nanobdellota archaeon]
MPAEDMVRTDVDHLINIVKSKGEVSFEDAAIELGQSFETVESWARFLEEEGELSIKYKFTTPYLVSENPETSQHKVNMNKLGKVSAEIGSAFAIISDNLENERHEDTHKKLNEVQKKTKELINQASNDKELAERVNFSTLQQRTDGVANLISHAKTLLSKKEYDRLKASYKKINSELYEIYNELKDPFMKLKQERKERERKRKEEALKAEQERKRRQQEETLGKEKSKESSDKGEKKKQEIDLTINGSEDYERLMKEAYDYLKKGDIDKVEKIYSAIRSEYNKLPEEYKSRKEKLDDSLLKLNKDISQQVTKKSSDSLQAKINRIEELIERIKKNIKASELDDAERDYKVIEEIYESIPEKFLDKKLDIENKIIDIHSLLVKYEKLQYTKQIQKGKNDINLLLKEILASIKNGDIEKAESAYHNAKEIFSGLPKGFIGEKIRLQNNLFSVYQRLAMLKEKKYEKDFRQKYKKIISLLKEVNELTKESSFEKAFKKLETINELFDSLPEGFISYKNSLEARILQVSKRLSHLRKEYARKEFERKKARIESLFEAIKKYMSRKEYDLAKNIYKEAMALYSSLPTGFMEEKISIKQRLLDAYRDITLSMNNETLKDVSSLMKKKYYSLLKILVSVHEHIQKKEFDLIEINYNHMVRIFNELPVGFVKRHNGLYKEVLKVKKELKLYHMTKRLKVSPTKELLEEIVSLYNELRDECKEDYMLFHHVKQEVEKYADKAADKKPENMSVEDYSESMRDEGGEIDAEDGDLDYDEAVSLLLSGDYKGAENVCGSILKKGKNTKAYMLKRLCLALEKAYEGGYDDFFSLIKSIKRDRRITGINKEFAVIKAIRAFSEFVEGNKDSAMVDLKRLSNILPEKSDSRNYVRVLGGES